MNRGSVRAFTLLEIMVVVALVGITSAIALSSTSETIALAKYRADRAKFYLSLTQARDQNRDRKTGSVRINLVPGVVEVQTYPAAGCIGGPLTVSIPVPALVYSPPGLGTCFSGTNASGPVMRFNDGRGGPNEGVDVAPDGRLADTWGEFGKEGALEGPGCDTDDGLNCGK